MKVGDLVRMPPSRTYWWGGKVGIIDRVESGGSRGYWLEYRVFVSAGRFASFSDTSFVELISESR